jgi:hypothetical protein
MEAEGLFCASDGGKQEDDASRNDLTHSKHIEEVTRDAEANHFREICVHGSWGLTEKLRSMGDDVRQCEEQ